MNENKTEKSPYTRGKKVEHATKGLNEEESKQPSPGNLCVCCCCSNSTCVYSVNRKNAEKYIQAKNSPKYLL